MVWGEFIELYVLLCLLVCRTKGQHVTHVSQSGPATAVSSPRGWGGIFRKVKLTLQI